MSNRVAEAASIASQAAFFKSFTSAVSSISYPSPVFGGGGGVSR